MTSILHCSGLEDANESAPQSASARDVVDTKMASWDAGNGWGQAGTTTGAPWRQDDIQDNDIQWESADNAENVQPGISPLSMYSSYSVEAP